MISTVTTTTLAATGSDPAGSLALIATLLLLGLLIQKEIVSVAAEASRRYLDRALTVVLAPLGLAFLPIVISAVVKVF